MGLKSIHFILGFTVLGLFLSSLVFGQTTTIEVQHTDQLQRLQASTIVIRNHDYVDFPKLVERMGGSSVLMPKRMRIDFDGTTAWVGLNDNRVNALSIFSLSQQVVSNEDGIFIALKDCIPFFGKAFRLSVSYTEPMRVASPDDSDFGGVDGGGVEDAGSISVPGVSAQPKVSRTIRTILIEPGHGGYEPGVEGPSGVAEKDVVLSISQRLVALLRDINRVASITMREQDSSLSPQQRNAYSLNTQADLLISIHAGGSFSEETQGIAIFYPEPKVVARSRPQGLSFREMDFSEESFDIAEAIGESLIEVTGATFRGIHPIPNALFKKSRRPSILIEVGCLTNPKEELLLSGEEYQAQIALGISKGIQRILDRAQALQEAPALEPVAPTLNNDSFLTEVSPL